MIYIFVINLQLYEIHILNMLIFYDVAQLIILVNSHKDIAFDFLFHLDGELKIYDMMKQLKCQMNNLNL